jgi:hypothetical protein
MFDITKFDPCSEGLEYFSGKGDFAAAWNACERGVWMLWIAKKLEVSPHTLSTAIRRAGIKEFVNPGLEDERRLANICREVLTEEVLKKYK